MKSVQKRQLCFAVICTSIVLCSCHSRNNTDAPSLKATASTQPIHSIHSPSPRSRLKRSKKYTGRGHNIATLDRLGNSAGANVDLLNANASPRANYKIAGIGRAQDPSKVYNWNWSTDFGGTVDAVTISF